ncbi:uncharacterized protein C15orf39 homolog isoform X1 [Melanerpes formicivorus]|uniref:uncharacterized protein C15orf39 homolog isoform X1 n=1 Tax=Melanerpes formicivorus TaxID=211600 RepID=UPI00358E68A7
MASKRHLEPLDPVVFNKLPRLETESTTTFSASLCKSSPVPNPGSESYFNYKGSYFACPLQSPEQPPARWSPAPTYLHYGPGANSQPMPAEGPLLGCLLYRPESLGTEKGKDNLVRELLLAREKWSSPSPAPAHPFPVKTPVAVNKATPLAVPKPVYRAPPACFMDPRMALLLGPRAESLQQRPRDVDWTLPAAPPASHPFHPGEPRSTAGVHRKGPHSEPALPPLHPSLALPTKQKVGSPVTFSSYYTAFEKYRGPPGTPFLEDSCPTAHSQKKMPEVPSLSPDPWAKLRPPSPVYRERPPMCYPLTHYPLPLQKAALLYHPLAPTMEAPPSALPGAYSGFGFAGRGEPIPGSHLKPQASRSCYFPSPLDTYTAQTVGAGTRASPPTKPVALPRDGEPPQPAGYLPSPSFAFSPGARAGLGTSLAGTETGCARRWAESPQRGAVTRDDGAVQPTPTPEKVSRSSDGLTEMFPSHGEQEPPYPGRRRTASPASQESPRGGPPAPIVVGKGDACKAKDADKEPVPPSPSASSPERLKNPGDSKTSPSSPPMPVINNVFSLASYRDYLEGTEASGQVPVCREHLWGDTPPQNTGGSQEPAVLRDNSVMSSLLPMAPAGGWELKMGSSVAQSQGESCYRGVPKKPKLVPPDPGSQEGSPRGLGRGEPAPEDVVLDLSLKKKMVKARETQGPTSHAERTLDREEEEEEEKEGPVGKEMVGEGTKPQVLPLLLEVVSGDKSNFQSSATFMFKKFKILRPSQPSSMPSQPSSVPFQPSSMPSQPSSVPSQPAGSPPTPQPSLLLLPARSSSIPTPPPWTPPASPLASSPSAPQPSSLVLRGAGLDLQQPLLPEAPRLPREEGILLPGQCHGPSCQTPAGQYFTTVHTWLCDIISCSVSRSSPELLQEWLKKAEPEEELGEMPKPSPKPKNGSRVPEAQKPTKGKEIWLAFQDVATLLPNLLSQLETFMFARKCPFPHVIRAGAVFIPIHVVKEKLFPKLPGACVDQVLQEHKVELRPTTLSEEKHLRDLELKSCTSRMLKLLAVKQLPDIYPDLLNLHWHNSIKQQLSSPGPEALKADGKEIATESMK